MLLGLALAAAAVAAPPGARGQGAGRAIVLSWDGVVPAEVHALLREGRLPHLGRLIADGALADDVVTAFPSKTAAGHASLWTGAPPRLTGISGNAVPRTPRAQHTMLDFTSGFASTALQAEPLWMAAARAGRRAVIVQATQGWPFEPYVRDGPFGPGQAARLVLFEGYAGILGGDLALTARGAPPRPAEGWVNFPPSFAPPLAITVPAGATTLHGIFIDDPADPTRGYDTLLIARDRDAAQPEARLKPGPSSPGTLDRWSPVLKVAAGGERDAGLYLRLFDLRPDGRDFLLYVTRPVRELSSRPELLPALRAAAGVFVGNGAGRLYEQGAFGRTIPVGGDGTAEQRYLETVRLVHRHLMAATRWVLERLPWDLVFAYTPFPDEAEHLWRGYLEPSLPGHRPEVAERLRPYLAEVYQQCDEFLGLVARLRPSGTVIALVSDHGMEGVDRLVRVNVALQRAGLLTLDAQGRVDLARTRAWYPPASNAYLLLNTRDRRGGIVDADERRAVVAAVRRALEEVRDGGRPLVTAVIDAEVDGAPRGIGGPAGGDVYLDLAPGYDFDARLDAAEVVVPRAPYGAHLFDPLRPTMRTLLVLQGPGVAAGRRLRGVRTIDVAPTLADLLGMPPPRHATGRVLVEALAR
ncbi:MAG: alkaline phosphatase family protein [Armatimonadota bacterium]|nr:alkaline phosphatase family protein [Armatimonadota bacterium]MDR7486999.1 alkaline phosphatase family protein [Armatimonadota bacterium]MDR7531730.1 alkaline phosphatase family protein [Armatimonadota bacterium]MDR7534926.1 alkaline phosphatase family protein [Armatimonadota bacterium]